MSDLSVLPSGTFDLVLITFTALSFSESPQATLSEIYRVLRPNGAALVSGLNRFSLRRLLRFRFNSALELYKTRKHHTSITSAPAHVFTGNQLREMAFQAGLTPIATHGMSVLSGVNESPSLLSANSFLSKAFPTLSHELLLEATKPAIPPKLL